MFRYDEAIDRLSEEILRDEGERSITERSILKHLKNMKDLWNEHAIQMVSQTQTSVDLPTNTLISL